MTNYRAYDSGVFRVTPHSHLPSARFSAIQRDIPVSYITWSFHLVCGWHSFEHQSHFGDAWSKRYWPITLQSWKKVLEGFPIYMYNLSPCVPCSMLRNVYVFNTLPKYYNIEWWRGEGWIISIDVFLPCLLWKHKKCDFYGHEILWMHYCTICLSKLQAIETIVDWQSQQRCCVWLYRTTPNQLHLLQMGKQWWFYTAYLLVISVRIKQK